MTEAAQEVQQEEAPQEEVQQGESRQEESNQNGNWYDGFADEDVGFVKNKGWDTPDKAIAAYRELEKFRGVPEDQLLKLPKDDDEEGWEQVYDRLGRPEKPEEYGEVSIDDVSIDTDRLSYADKVFHEAGLTRSQRNKVVEAIAKYEQDIVSKGDEEFNLNVENDMNALKKEWGQAFDERIELGRRAARSFLPGDDRDEMLDKLESSIGTAAVLKMFANIGEKIGEHNVAQGDGGRPFGYTPEQAKADIQQLKNELQGDADRLKVYNEGKGVDFDKMKKLIAIANS